MLRQAWSLATNLFRRCTAYLYVVSYSKRIFRNFRGKCALNLFKYNQKKKLWPPQLILGPDDSPNRVSAKSVIGRKQHPPDLGESLKKPLLTYCVLPQKLEQVRRICHREDLAVIRGVRGIVEPRLGGTTTQLFPQVAVVLCKVGDRSILFIIINYFLKVSCIP